MSDSAQFEWLVNVLEDTYQGKETLSGLQSRSTVATTTLDEADGALTRSEVLLRQAEHHMRDLYIKIRNSP